MKLWSLEQIARFGIMLLFVVVVRSLSEYFRLKYFQDGPVALGVVEPLIAGSLIAVLCTWAAVIFYFLRRYRTVIAISAGTIVLLLAYKIYTIR